MLTKIAAIQMASGPQIKANLMEATRLIREAANKGAQMVVLPESFALMAMSEYENIDVAEKQGSGYIQDLISQTAIDNKIWIVAGSIPIHSNEYVNDDSLSDVALNDSSLSTASLNASSAVASAKPNATSLMYNDKGEIVARYDKIHLFDVDIDGAKQKDGNNKIEHYRESDTFEAGKNITVVDTPFGKIGMSICYDLRFPMLYREMVKQGAEIFLIPSAFAHTTGKMHWQPLLRARAIENQCYVIAPAQGGFHVNGRQTYGHTMAIDYLGQVQAKRLKGTGIITMTIDLAAQRKVRDSFPVLKHSTLI